MMYKMRARLVAYVQPPGVTWVSDEGSSDLHRIFVNSPDDYRYAVVYREGQYQIMDFWATKGYDDGGWLVPVFIASFNDQDAAIASAVLTNP